MPFPKESDRLLNPYKRKAVPQISEALGHERAQFTLYNRFVPSVHNCSKLFQSWSWSQEKKGRPGLFQKQLPSSKSRPFPKVKLFNPLPLLLPISLSLSLSLSLSHSLSLSLFLFLPFFSLLLPFNSKKEVEKVTQSTCWTPFTTSNTSTTHTTHITSSLAKNNN